MNITKIELMNFRNYTKKTFDNFSNLNIIIGKNAIGNTSIIESIYLGSLAKSFKTNNELSIIKEGTKKHKGITHKSPIVVKKKKKIIFFPTTSAENEKCVWINLEKIDKYYKLDPKRTAIVFKNGDLIELDISYGSLTNQILRASRLKFLLDQRILKKDNII